MMLQINDCFENCVHAISGSSYNYFTVALQAPISDQLQYIAYQEKIYDASNFKTIF